MHRRARFDRVARPDVASLPYGSTWPLPPAAYDVGYTYCLAEQGGRTTLAIEIGDFAELAHGEDFYEASLDFGDRASRRIRELAEGM